MPSGGLWTPATKEGRVGTLALVGALRHRCHPKPALASGPRTTLGDLAWSQPPSALLESCLFSRGFSITHSPGGCSELPVD